MSTKSRGRYFLTIRCPDKGACGHHPDAEQGWAEDVFVEEGIPDFLALEERAIELASTHPWVSMKAHNFADTDNHLGSYGTEVRHEITPTPPTDRRGRYHCRCGDWMADDEARRQHLDNIARSAPAENLRD